MRARAPLILLLSTLLVLPVSTAALQQDGSWARSIEALIAAGRLPEARARFSEQEEQRRASYPGLLLEARLLTGEQRFRDSLGVLERCLAMRRDDPEAYKLVAWNAIRLDRLEAAEEALGSAKRLAPGDGLVHFHLGALYYTQSRFLDARPELERAVSLRPEYMPAQLFLGLVLEELGGEQAAVDTYRKAIALNEAQGGKNELPYQYLGRLFYRLNRFPEALPLLRRASETNAGSGEVWLWLGKTYSSLGQAEEAIPALQRAIQADRQSPEPHYVLSRVYLAQHRDRESAEELARFRELQVREKKKDDGRRKRP
jgi:tetratricopeptide (TPR) repeat protein